MFRSFLFNDYVIIKLVNNGALRILWLIALGVSVSQIFLFMWIVSTLSKICLKLKDSCAL